MKLMNLVLLTVGIIVLLNAGGFTTATGGLVGKLTDGQLADFKNSAIYVSLVAILTGLGVGILIGTFTRVPPTDYVVAGLVLLFAGFVLTDLVFLFNLFWSFGAEEGTEWVRWVASAIFIPVIVAFFMSILDWWRFGQ